MSRWIRSSCRLGRGSYVLAEHVKLVVLFPPTGRIVLQAYSPLGSTGSPLMKEQIVQDIAKKHDIEAGNVLLSYLNNRGIVGESPTVAV